DEPDEPDEPGRQVILWQSCGRRLRRSQVFHGGFSMGPGGLVKNLPVVFALAVAACAQNPSSTVGEAPSFRVDPAWPRPLPEENGVQLVLGQVAGIAVDDRNGHVWIVHRPSTLLADEWDAKERRPVTHRCCKPAPPVVEFDAAGNYLRGWGPADAQVQWPKS